MQTKLILIGAMGWVFCAYPLRASTLDRAESAYSAGQYDQAAKLYLERALDQAQEPANGSVYHNLGLAFDRQKDLGLAVAAYLRAVQLEPRQGDFQYNLRFLLEQSQDKLDAEFPQEPLAVLWEGAGRYLSEREVFYLALGSMVISSLLMNAAWLRPKIRRGALVSASLSGLCTLALLTALSYKLWGQQSLGAVVVKSLSAYSGPTESVVIFEIHQGAPFQILNTSGDWVKISLSDQKQGWVKKDGIASFGKKATILPSDGGVKS
jgi:tetratricopeptide (TPR) repeat protein